MADLTDSEIQKLFAKAESVAQEWEMPEDTGTASVDDLPVELVESLMNPDAENENAQAAPKSEAPKEEAPKEEATKDEAPEENTTESAQAADSSKSDDPGGMMSQDDIEALVAQATAQRETPAKKDDSALEADAQSDPDAGQMASESSDDSGSDGGIMSQDDIDALVAGARSETTSATEPENDTPQEPPQPAKEAHAAEDSDSGNDGLMSQDDIEALVAKAAEKEPTPAQPKPEPEAPDVASKEQPETPESIPTAEPSGDGLMSQDDIEKMIADSANQASQADGAASEVPGVQTPSPSPPPEAPTEPSDNTDSGMMNQDDIQKLIMEQKQQQQASRSSLSEEAIAAMFSGAPKAPSTQDDSAILSEDNPAQMWESKVKAIQPPANSAIPPEELANILQKPAPGGAPTGADDGMLSQEQISNMLKEGPPAATAQVNGASDTLVSNNPEKLKELVQKTEEISRKLGVIEEDIEPTQGATVTPAQAAADQPAHESQFEPELEPVGAMDSIRKKIEGQKAKKKMKPLAMIAGLLVLIACGGYFYSSQEKMAKPGEIPKVHPAESYEWEKNKKEGSSAKFKIHAPGTFMILSHLKKIPVEKLSKIKMDTIKAAYEMRKKLGKIKDYHLSQEVRYFRSIGDNVLYMLQFDYAYENLAGTKMLKRSAYFPVQNQVYKVDFTYRADKIDEGADSKNWIELEKIFRVFFGLDRAPLNSEGKVKVARNKEEAIGQDFKKFQWASDYLANRARGEIKAPEKSE